MCLAVWACDMFRKAFQNAKTCTARSETSSKVAQQYRWHEPGDQHNSSDSSAGGAGVSASNCCNKCSGELVETQDDRKNRPISLPFYFSSGLGFAGFLIRV